MQAMTSAVLLAGSGLFLSATAFAANHVVTANTNMTFTPSAITITAGDTITFQNGGGIHNAQSDPGSITAFRCANGCDGAGGNGNISSAAWSATVTFPTAGTVRYFCQAHGAPNGVGMSGVITINAAPVPVARRSDFDGDGRSDILWRNTGSGANVIWRAANAASQQAMPTVSLAWRVVGSGDYNGGGSSDILWRNASSGANVIWRSGNSGTQQGVTGVANLAWTVAGSGDYDGDGRADILWRNASTGANVIWRAASASSQQALPTIVLSWRVVGSGDYYNDGRTDILWRNASSGANVIWRSGNPATTTAVTGVSNLAWTVVGTGDYNGDGGADILWRNTGSGANVIWRSANPATTQAVAPVPSQAWTVVGLPE
jgi:plastocyanin